MIIYSRRGCGFLWVLLSLLAGCSQMNLNSVVKEPSVQVQNITVREVNLDSVGLDLVMQVTNPNAYTLALAGYDYRIRFNDHQLVEGSTDEGFRVAANASNQIRVPFKVGFKDVMKLLDSMGDSNTLHYEVDADMRLDAPVLNLFNIKSHKKGDITIPQLPQVSFGDLKVKSFNFTEASFELAMQITNPNQFGLDLKDLDYQFSVGGEKWFDGRIDQTVKIGEKQTTTVKIPVSVSLLKLGSGAFSAIQKGNFTDYSLDANFTLDSTYPALKNLQIPLHYKP